MILFKYNVCFNTKYMFVKLTVKKKTYFQLKMLMLTHSILFDLQTDQ